MSPRADLTIMHMPTKGNRLTPAIIRRGLRLARREKVQSIGITEGHWRIPFLSRRAAWRITVGSSPNRRKMLPGNAGNAGDTPMLTRRSLLAKGLSVRTAEPAAPLLIAPDRWTTSVVYSAGRRTIEHINLHPHAVIEGVDPDTPRVREYARQMYALRDQIRDAKRAGRVVVVSGDLNFPLRASGVPDYAPQAVFKATGLDFWCEGIDWVAWDPDHLRIVQRVKVAPADQGAGQDHPWMIAGFDFR